MKKNGFKCSLGMLFQCVITLMVFIPFILPGIVFAGERLCVSSKVANVRSGPGANNEVLWQIEKYHPLLVLQKKGNWYKFKDFEGDSAWIHKSLVGKTKAVITVKKKCNVRAKPSTASEILFSVEKGVPFKVLADKGNWKKIEHVDGDSGWIHKSLVW